MDESLITEQEIVWEVTHLKSVREGIRIARVIVGLLILGGAYLLYDACPEVRNIPFAAMTLKDLGTGIMYGLGVLMLLGTAFSAAFGGIGDGPSNYALREEAKENLRNLRNRKPEESWWKENRIFVYMFMIILVALWAYWSPLL